MGIHVDVASGMVTIPHEKCLQILDACHHYTTKKQITRKQLQSLLGKLIYLHRCIPASRIFVNRLLNTLRQCPHRVTVSEDMRKDLAWFIQFLVKFNGKVLFPAMRQKIDVYVDASLSGMGAFWNENAYAVSRHIAATAGWSISHLEMLNVMVALRVFAHAWRGKHVEFHIDNLAVVFSLQFSRMKDQILQAIVRTIWLLAATHDIQLSYSHIPGIQNKEADALSRVFQNQELDQFCKDLLVHVGLYMVTGVYRICFYDCRPPSVTSGAPSSLKIRGCLTSKNSVSLSHQIQAISGLHILAPASFAGSGLDPGIHGIPCSERK